MGAVIDKVRVKSKYEAVRFSLLGETADQDLKTSNSVFKVASANSKGYDYGLRQNIKVYPTTSAIWIKYNAITNDNIFVPADAWYEDYNIEANNLYMRSAIETTAQIETVQCVADVATSLNSTYFYLYVLDATTGVELVHGYWFDVDSGGTEPTDTLVDTWHEVDISEDDTATTIATALELVTEATTGLTSTSSTDTVTVTHSDSGARRNGTDGPSTSTGFTFAVTTPGDGLDTTVHVVLF